MKLTTQPNRPTITGALANRHMAQADECLRLAKEFNARGDAARCHFWRRMREAKREDATNVWIVGASR